MPLSTTPTVVRRYVAFELRRLRERSGLSQQQAAKVIDTSQTRMAHFESGRNLPRLHDLALLLQRYDAEELTELIQELILEVRDTHTPLFELDSKVPLPPGFDMYLGLEQGASQITTYDAMTIMGILQCRPYAEALLRGHDTRLPDAEVERLVDLRMRRQEALDRDDRSLDLVMIIDESVLRRQIGGPKVLAAQLDYLEVATERHNVTIRILPFSAGVHPALHGPFILLRFPIESYPGVVYLEDRLGGRYSDNEDDIREYTSVTERLLELALPGSDSLSMIRKTRKEIAP